MSEISKTVLAVRYIAGVLRTLEYGTELPKLPMGVTLFDIYSISKKHSLASTVYYALEDEVSSLGNTELIARFEKARSLDFVMNMKQTDEFAHLTKLFTENKHPFLPMKGFLFKELWKRPEYRTMADMDFYVSEEELGEITAMLESDGYIPDHEGDVHDTFNKPPFIHIEIHKALRHGSTDSFDCWCAREDNPYWYVMSPLDFMLFNVSHIHKHYTTGGCGMRSLFDVFLYLNKKGDSLDKAELDRRLAEEGLCDFYHAILHLAHFWFGEGEISIDINDERYLKNNLPTDALLEMEFFISTGGAYGNLDNKVEYGMRGRSRLSYILSRAFPRYSIMCSIFKWLRKYPFLLPIAYLVRLARSLFDGRLGRELKATDKVSKKREK